jgi:PAS domain S-box-containing protein
MANDRTAVDKSRFSILDEADEFATSLVAAANIAVGPRARDVDLRAVLDALPAAIYTTDAAGRVTYFNRAAAELAGREPVVGSDEWCVTWRLFNADGTPLPHAACPMAIAIKENRAVRGCEAILERPDGTRVPFIAYPTPLRDASGRLIGAVNMLVEATDRKAAEITRAYLAAIIESSDDAIISKDLNGVVMSWNRGAERIFGYSAADIVGRPILILLPPNRLEEEDLILAKLRRGERMEHFETVRRRQDGQDIDVSLTISPVHGDDGRIIGVSKIARDITDRKRVETALRIGEERYRLLNAALEQRVSERTSDLANANRQLLAEAADRERTEAALLQAQKMEVVGQLAAGMAHDFNNLLTAIIGNLELVEAKIEDPGVRKLVQNATRAAFRGAHLNEQMLAFSRKQHLTPGPVDLNALVGDMSELLHRTLGGMVQVGTELNPELWSALADPTQIELVVLNLVINARDAMPQGGMVWIATENIAAGSPDKPTNLKVGDYVRISVSDEGVGMNQAVLARACEPFFTTKEPGKGSGLGLSQVYGVARQLNGDIRIDSVEGEGTTVTVYLPRSLGETLPRSSVTPLQSSVRQLTILVVDDEPGVREVTAAHLDSLEHAVLQAPGGLAALKLLIENKSIDLLIADYAMAEMNGFDLAQAARELRPQLPIIVMTGYSDVSAFDSLISEAVFLKKPFRMGDLAAAIETATRRPTAGP